MRQRVLEVLSNKGTLIEPEAAELLCGHRNALEMLESYIAVSKQELPMIITTQYVEKILHHDLQTEVLDTNILTKSSIGSKDPREIGVSMDITGRSTCVGDIADFMSLFHDRFKTIKRLLLRRRELQGSVAVSKAKRLDRDVKLIGMVGGVRTTKNGHRILEVEDEDDSIAVLILKSSPAFDDAVLNDEVIGVIGNMAKKGEMVVAKEIIRPDIPINGGLKKNDSDSWAVFVGDIHVGSNAFLENQWNAFIEWLKYSDDARKVNYLVVPGDLVDGIGIYPDQEEELAISDVYEQYERLAENLKEVRDDIRIILSPGNHDAVRLAEPQPALPQSIGKFFDSNVKLIGNPAMVNLEERNILVYHGRSFDDWIAAAPGFSYDRPLDIMREMLRRRHLAPIYGERTAIAPEKKDYLLINDVSDIFVTGHIHKAGLGDYRGVIMINASTWQDQTAFQKMHNHVPDPCKAFMIHLGTGKARIVKFT